MNIDLGGLHHALDGHKANRTRDRNIETPSSTKAVPATANSFSNRVIKSKFIE